MIIGNGLIANAFREKLTDPNVVLFASGPSDSKNTSENEYRKEHALIRQIISENPEKLIIYFSTASVLDSSLSETDYCRHKLNMEEFISKQAGNYIIIRASNVVGKTGNPKTIFNYLKNRIESGEKFELWRNAERNLIDINDLVKIVIGIVKDNIINSKLLVANTSSITVSELVRLMENKLGKAGNYFETDKGSALSFVTDINMTMLNNYNVHFNDTYYSDLIEKYVR